MSLFFYAIWLLFYSSVVVQAVYVLLIVRNYTSIGEMHVYFKMHKQNKMYYMFIDTTESQVFDTAQHTRTMRSNSGTSLPAFCC